ncbi:MAG: FliM/FliN family flagellar motor switch protein [Myxococcales bacterium]|nr:FliM/FliN family flagellar motor switch protein [Myxococcales bacterium]
MSTTSPFLAPVNHTLIDQASYLARKIVPGLRRRLVNRVGSDLAVSVSGVAASTMGEQLDAVRSGPAALATLTVGRARMAIVLQGRVLSRLLSMMLGADPSSPDESDRVSLTRIDLRVGGRLCDDLAEALAEQTGTEVSVMDVRPAPRSLVWASRSTKVVVMELTFGPEDKPFGSGAVVVPFGLSDTLFGTTAGVTTNRQAEVERVLPVEVEVIAELARIPLVVADLQALQVGSLLDLGSAGEIVLSVNGKPTLLAEAGEADGVRSIRVLRRMGVAAG